MKKILAVCGQGLGSSLLIEMNLKDVLANLNRDDLEAAHTNLNSFDPTDTDILAVVCGLDLEESIDFDRKIILQNLFDKNELETKLESFLAN
ncbi:PTS system IIB component (L-Asc family) [Entomoplasma freundtii]|uniref:PTS system, ascorbate-specific IIB component n=1 Tax=Entomoplasma freundtii TaxID=74700 RepID=A0A2K8NR96_9MOLU|nr:hypothetical protein [Entomoplasma freundtii]ATZ16304.1 PTS system, ascorbate-specific IIB component [Entomoplasma freundtii]TDY56794.1 PTS system IIB component (L-Asc family) [Entomoplasma freundtii]